MSAGEDNELEQHGGRSPFALALCSRAIIRFVFRRACTLPAIDWRSTLSQSRRRFFWGLRWSLAVCLLLAPALFCPWPETHRSLYEQMGRPVWLGWGATVVMAGLGMAFAVTTRAKLQDTGSVQAFSHWPESNEG
mgnify:CR=1 FL=1